LFLGSLNKFINQIKEQRLAEKERSNLIKLKINSLVAKCYIKLDYVSYAYAVSKRLDIWKIGSYLEDIITNLLEI